MAIYKQPCRACGEFISRDSTICPKCGSRSPFVDLCPTCLREVSREDKVCSSCGRPLYITCPKCKAQTFVSDKCDVCGENFLRKCPNPRCGQLQFFENKKCTACGKSMDGKASGKKFSLFG